MIDIHSHILPGIDDGAETLSESLLLARFAVNNGITHSVITPHIHHGRYENDIISIKNAFDTLQQALWQHSIPLKIAFAAEVRISVEMMTMIAANNIPFGLGQMIFCNSDHLIKQPIISGRHLTISMQTVPEIFLWAIFRT